MLRNARVNLLMAATLAAAGCARSDFAVSRNDRSYWQAAQKRNTARAVQAPPPKILPETYFAAARLHETRGQFVEAIEQYRKAIAVNHKYVEAYHRLGVLLGAMGKFPEAREVLSKAVQLSPKDPILRNNLGFQLVMQEDWQGARREFTRATELSPGFARAHINLGMVFSKLGHFDQALVEFRTVLPEPDAQYNLGLMFRSQKRFQEAANAFHKTLQFNPHFTAAQKQLDQLKEHLPNVEAAKSIDTPKVAQTPEATAPLEEQAQEPRAVAVDAQPKTEGLMSIETPQAAEVTDSGETTEEPGHEPTVVATSVEPAAEMESPCSTSSTLVAGEESPRFELGATEEEVPTPFEQRATAGERLDVQSPETTDLFAGADKVFDTYAPVVDARRPVPPPDGIVSEDGFTVSDSEPEFSSPEKVGWADSAGEYAEHPCPEEEEALEVHDAMPDPAVKRAEVATAPAPVLADLFGAAEERPLTPLLECIADAPEIPASWNEMEESQRECINAASVLRELEVDLNAVRSEINCLDDQLAERAYRTAPTDTKESVQPPPAATVATAPSQPAPEGWPTDNLAEVPSPKDQPTNADEAVSPKPAGEEPILVREEWAEPEPKTGKKEPAAMLDSKHRTIQNPLDGGTGGFDGLLDLCAVLENEMRCLAEQQSGGGAIMSPVFDPGVDSVIPPSMPFELLLDVVWSNLVFPAGEDLVCAAEPAWCVAEGHSAEQTIAVRFPHHQPGRRASWRQ